MLILRDIEDITAKDLEAIGFNFPLGTEGLEIEFQPDNYKFHWKAKRGIQIEEGYLTLKDFDYLRYTGYALPAYGFTIQELIEAGVYRILLQGR